MENENKQNKEELETAEEITTIEELETAEETTPNKGTLTEITDIKLSAKMDETIKTLKNKHFDMNDFGMNQWINVSDLLIDEDTQRGVMPSQVEKIIKDFNPASFGRITVSKREDGYYVVNGQHRVFACKKIGVERIPCIVIQNSHTDDVNKKKQDAINFLEINQNSQAVRAIDKYRIGVSAQLEDWLNVKQVIEENGLKAGTTVNSVNCLACIYRYINTPSALDTRNAKKKQISKSIKILKETAGVSRITHVSLQAVSIIVREYVDTNLTTVDKLITKFNKIELDKMISSAITLKNNGTGKNVVSYLAFLLVQEYNGKCRKEEDKLPVDRIDL